MSELERIGISLGKHLLAQFDELIAQRNYPNRSEAIRDLIRQSLSERGLAKPTTAAVGAVFLVYDHHAMKLSQRLVEIQHQYLVQTVASTHVHLDHHNCLEIIILKGKVKDINEIADRIITLKGVKLSRLNMMSIGARLS